MNLAHLLQRAACAFSDRPAVALGTTVVANYGTLAARVAALAGGLRASGLPAGARIALVMQNSTAYLELFLASWWAGLTAVPIHSKLHPKELAFIFGNARVSAVFASANTASACTDALQAMPEEARQISFFEVSSRAFAALYQGTPLPITAVADDQTAWIFYTSGTTGRPKGVELTHRNLYAATQSYFTDVDDIATTDCIIHAAPMSHGSGMYIVPHLARAACNVIPESGGFDAGEIGALWQHFGGAAMFAAPTMVKRLTDYAADLAPTGLKTIVYGGGPMYVADLMKSIDRFGQRFAQIYGQGEAPMTITALSKALHREHQHPRYAERMGSVGLPFTGVEVVVANVDGGLPTPLPTGEIGEICVRGPQVMKGYLDNPAANAHSLRGGWLLTGDVGAFDAEGFLTLKDRSKDLVISGGQNIYPREIEEVLLTHTDVSEVSVIGVPHAEWGEEVVAYVVARGKAQDTEALNAHCLDNLARFKRPKRYVFVESLPKNETGKVLKTALRALSRPQ